jgi:uncharacterized protein DUF234
LGKTFTGVEKAFTKVKILEKSFTKCDFNASDRELLLGASILLRGLHAYMGLIFERAAQQAFVSMRPRLELPIVHEWGRWEGLDRDRQQTETEIDIVARQTDGAMLTGAVKWSAKPVGSSLHDKHLDMLTRLSQSGYSWAREALAPGAVSSVRELYQPGLSHVRTQFQCESA